MKKLHFSLRKIRRQHLVGLLLALAFLIGLASSLFIYSAMINRQEVFFEVTFVEPRQAIVFWKTERKTLGHVRYGTQAYRRNQVAQQSSSTPEQIHAVVLSDVPLDGVYLSLHDDSQRFVLWPKVRFIKYEPNYNE